MTTRLLDNGTIQATFEGEKADFWACKTPCFEMCHCPSIIKDECPALHYKALPCWQIEGTYCKLDDRGASGTDTSICEVCRVYKRYGDGKPIELKLKGRGIATSLGILQETNEEPVHVK